MKQAIINLELTSACNRKCIVCPQGNKNSKIIKNDISIGDFDAFLKRVKESSEDGLHIREIINSGYGESLLHKKLDTILKKYSLLKKSSSGKIPKISIVTNGSIFPKNPELFVRAVDILKFSFPTSNPENYGYIMTRSRKSGNKLLRTAKENLLKYMNLYKDGKLKELRIHISPPYILSYKDFPETINFLTKLASSINLDNIKIVIFPSTSNRAGTIEKQGFINTFYRKHKKRFDNKVVNGVKITMFSELNVFYPKTKDVLLVLLQKFPCIWKSGSMSIDSKGNYRFCINDAESRFIIGNIHKNSISSIYNKIKKSGKSPNCADCNENPVNMGSTPLQRLYSFAARVRMKF